MITAVSRPAANPWWLLVLAVALAGSAFLLQGHSGLNLADEGFLWYGVQATTQGQLPLRDFQSYDPGRYYWSAASALILGKGLIALRMSEAALQTIGLWAGLLTASRLSRNWIVLGVIGLTLTVWMFPTHKLFDHAVLLAGIWSAMRMVERPSRGRMAWAGIFLGLCTFFGRNHALYNGVAQLLLLLLLWQKADVGFSLSRFVDWGAGIVVGMLPLVAMIVFVPGFFGSYEQSVAAILRSGANLGLPVPWPWRVPFLGDLLGVGRAMLLGVLMMALPATYLAILGGAIFSPARFLRDHPVPIACAPLGLFYLHHIYSRADLSHLAQAIHPFLFGLLGLVFLFRREHVFLAGTASLLLVIGLFELLPPMPSYQRLVSPVPWTRSVAADGVFLPGRWAESLDALKRFSAEKIRPDEGIFIAPSSPGLYPILERDAPVWEIDLLFPGTRESQEKIINALASKGINWAIISNTPPDRRDDLRFSATYPLVWNYLQQNFRPVAHLRLPGGMVMLQRIGFSREGSPPKTSLPLTH